MKEIVETIKELNRAFNHNAEPVFVNTETLEINTRYAPSFDKSNIPDEQVFKWMEGNYGYVHPDYPNLLFFAVNRLGDPAVFSCCGPPMLFLCTLCNQEHPITPRSLANHEFIHSLQLKTNPYIESYFAEKDADEIDLMDLVQIVNIF